MRPVLVLVGPTAVGKTAVSLRLAKTFDCEIINVDSMQVYRLMDIGTAKPGADERQGVPHHLLDVIWPDEHYDAGRFAREAWAACEEIHLRGRIPLLTGGTGLYLRAWRDGLTAMPDIDPALRHALRQELASGGREAMLEEVRRHDPATAERLHPNDSQRLLRALELLRAGGIPSSVGTGQRQGGTADRPSRVALLQIGLGCERETLYQRINRRCHQMLEQGLEEEVASLLSLGYGTHLKSMQAIGYRHMAQRLQGELTPLAAAQSFMRDTRRYAKRQMTWFTREQLTWHDRGAMDKIMTSVAEWLQKLAYPEQLDGRQRPAK